MKRTKKKEKINCIKHIIKKANFKNYPQEPSNQKYLSTYLEQFNR